MANPTPASDIDDVKPDPAHAGTDSDSGPDNDNGFEDEEPTLAGDKGEKPESKKPSLLDNARDAVKSGVKKVYSKVKDANDGRVKENERIKKEYDARRAAIEEANKLVNDGEINNEPNEYRRKEKMREIISRRLSSTGVNVKFIDEAIESAIKAKKIRDDNEKKESDIAIDKEQSEFIKSVLDLPEIKDIKDKQKKREKIKEKVKAKAKKVYRDRMGNGISSDFNEKRFNQAFDRAYEQQESNFDDLIDKGLKGEDEKAKINAKKAEAAKKKADAKPIITTEKFLLASTLAVHTGVSIGGMVVDGTVAVAKGTGRLIREEVVGIANSGVELGKQVGKTVVFPVGRIGYGAKNRFSRGLDWALNWPTDHSDSAIVKKSHAPEHHDEPKADAGHAAPAAAASGPSKPNILSRGIDYVGGGMSSIAGGMWNLTKKAWYRTQQAVLATVVAPTGFVLGALEGAALAIPHDIIGVHWEGEASVSETGAAERKTTDKKFHVDGGALGILLAGGKTVKDIVWDAPIRAFEEQLTTIKETPVEAEPKGTGKIKNAPRIEDSLLTDLDKAKIEKKKHTKPDAGGGHEPEEKAHDKEHEKPAEKIVETDSAGGEHHEDNDDKHKKHSTLPVHTDPKKGGFFKAFKGLSEIWSKDEIDTADFDAGISAIEGAFGTEDSVSGNFARGIRRLFGPKDVPTMEIDYENLAEQISHLKPKDRASFFKSIDIIKFQKKIRLLVDEARFDDALKSDEGKSDAKKQITALFGTHGKVDFDDLETILDDMYTKLFGTTPPNGAKQMQFAAAMGRITTVLEEPTIAVDDRRLTKLYGAEKKVVNIDYSKFADQVHALKPNERNGFLDSLQVSSLNREFWMIMDATRLADSLKDDDTEHSNRTAIKKKIEAALHIEGRVTPGEVSTQIDALKIKFAGMTRTDSKITDMGAALDKIVLALTPTNITKIYGKEAKEVEIDYTKFGVQALKLKDDSAKEAFLRSFDSAEFQSQFFAIMDNARLKESLEEDDAARTNQKSAKAKIASFLGVEGIVKAADVTRIVAELRAQFTGLAPATNIDAFLATIIPALDADNLTKVYSNETKEPEIDTTKFGAQVSKLKGDKEKKAFAKAFNQSEFNKEFSMIMNERRLKDLLDNDDDTFSNKKAIKEKIAAVLNIAVGAKITNAEVKGIIASLQATFAGATTNSQISDSLDRIKKALSSANLDKIFSNDVKKTTIKYKEFGKQLFKTETKDIEKFVEAFDKRDFKGAFSQLLTEPAFKIAMNEPEKVKVLIVEMLGFDGTISSHTELDGLITDLTKKIAASTNENAPTIRRMLGEAGTVIKSYRAAFGGETAFEVLYPATNEPEINIDYAKFGATSKALRKDKDKNKFLETFDLNKFDENFLYLLSDLGLNSIEKNAAMKPKMQEQVEQLLGRKPLTVDEFKQLIDSVWKSLDLADPLKMTPTATTNFTHFKTKLEDIEKRFTNANNFEKVFKSTPDLRKVIIDYDRFGNGIPKSKEDISNFLFSLEMGKVMGKYHMLTNETRLKTMLLAPTDPGNTDLADNLISFLGMTVKPKDLTSEMVKDFKKIMLANLDKTKLGLGKGMPLYKELSDLNDFINRILP